MRRILKLITSVCCLFFTTCHNTFHKDAKRNANFPIHRETTFFTEPVDALGYVDYPTALNRHLSQGVTPQNNANVLIWEAVGPHPEQCTMPSEFYEWLGIQAPPEQGDYFQTFTKHLRLKELDPERIEKLDVQFGESTRKPWKPNQHPEIVAWLSSQQKPLALITTACKRSRYFSPLVPEVKNGRKESLMSVKLPTVQLCRAIAAALLSRAMLHVGQGKHDEAWQDILTCFKLGRHIAQGCFLIQLLVGYAIDAVTCTAAEAFLQLNLSAKKFQACMNDLKKLPPMPSTVEATHLGERAMLLETIARLNRIGMRTLAVLEGDTGRKKISAFDEARMHEVKWEPALKIANRWFDRLVSVLRLPDRTEREAKLEQLSIELAKMRDAMKLSGKVRELLVTIKEPGNDWRAGRILGRMLVSLLLPAFDRVQEASDRVTQQHRNLQIAFALAAYQSDQKRYPETLDDLSPKYLTAIPEDLFSDGPPIYRRTEKGYLLYSVGTNGFDEDGSSFGDEIPGDDLRVRIP